MMTLWRSRPPRELLAWVRVGLTVFDDSVDYISDSLVGLLQVALEFQEIWTYQVWSMGSGGIV